MDLGPCDHRRSARIQRSSRCHASCKTDTVWEHSSTRRKYVDILRLNRGAPYLGLALLSPNVTRAHYTRGPSTCEPSATWRPTRAPTWTVRVASCHASAPLAPCVGRPGSATWPKCHVAPRVGPARHVSRRLTTSAPTGNKTPFFAILLIENT